MRAFSFIAVLAALGILGCSSDEGVVCDRLAECDLMPEGLSAEECEEQAVRQVGEKRLERCAECVEEHECSELIEACRSDCEPGD